MAVKARTNEELLTPDFLRKLEQLSFTAKRTFAGKTRGERRSKRHGASVEFADYRNYSPGDDFRRVDWNVYSRLEKLFLKLFIEEEDLNVYILIDASASMDFGNPSKLLYAKRAAAALGQIALSSLDRVGFASLSGGSVRVLPPKRGRGSIFPILDWIGGIESGGTTDLTAALQEFTLRTRRPGVAILISDLFDPDYEKGLLSLLSRRFETSILHILDDEEVRPQLSGDLRLIDSESGEEREVSITSVVLSQYEKDFNDFCGRIDGFSNKYGINCIRTTVSADLESLILTSLRRRGMVK